MTIKFYKRFQIIFFAFFIPLYILINVNYSWCKSNPVLFMIIYYSFHILSLVLLYFGIYSHISKIKNVRRYPNPTTLIFFGLMFTFISFGSSIMGFLLYDVKIEQHLSNNQIQARKAMALDTNRSKEERLAAAKIYYLFTGESIEYLDEYGNKALFSPSNHTLKDRKAHFQLKEYGKIISIHKKIIINLIAASFISLLGFLVFLRYKFKSSGGT